MKTSAVGSCSALALSLVLGCAAEAVVEDAAAQEPELNQVFRSTLQDLGAIPLEQKTIHYAEDPRPFEDAFLGVSQTEGESRYVAYELEALKGDGLLLSAHKTSATETSGSCDEVVRLWLLDSSKRVVRTGTQSCEYVYEEPGLTTKSNILRHYVEKDETFKIVVAVLPARNAATQAPIRTQPWKWVSLDVIRSHEENQGGLQSRCQDGADVLCKPELKCERARCK